MRYRRMRMRVVWRASVAAAMPLMLGAVLLSAQDGTPPELEILHVRGDIYMIAGGGGNTTVQAGPEGLVVVDTELAQFSDQLLAALRTLSPKEIHFIINTHVHDDHTGGNEALSRAGPTRPGRSPQTGGMGGNVGAATTVVAHENVLNRMTRAGRSSWAWPTETFFAEKMEIFFNDEPIIVYHEPAGHTDGDSIVFFRRTDVIATGDVFTTVMYPFIDTANGGHVNGIIEALNHIIDLAIPDHHVQEGGTLIVPGHGRLCDEQDVIEYRDMLTIVRDRIQYMLDQGMTLEQVKAARPTLDWDARYGSDTGFWTTEMFIETIYRNLSEPVQETAG